MAEVHALNGFILYNSFLSGYESLSSKRDALNAINVFPVADGDTGSNMVSTLYTTIRSPRVSRSLSSTLASLADRALSGARGNSGIILAQYLNSLAIECSNRETMTTEEFGQALINASVGTRKAVETPRDGTLITLLDVWSGEMYRLGRLAHDFNDVFVKSLDLARVALEKTRDQLEELRKAQVVDAGASGFVSFLEGIAVMILSGVVPQRPQTDLSEEAESDHIHDIPVSSDTITYRYCTEALVLRPIDSPVLASDIHEKLRELGDSLIVTNGKTRTKLHIHTDKPSQFFFLLREAGTIEEQKVDDMRSQFNSVHHPVSKIAIVTDSIADIPSEMIDSLRIHVIPQKILWGKDEYLDRLTITGDTFYPYLDERSDYPSSSVPDIKRVSQVFSWLSSHYDSIIAIPVAKALSGTCQVFESAAVPLKSKGYPISIVDSRLNSAAQGLTVLSAAQQAADGGSHEEILERLQTTIAGAKILVGVDTFKYMVRGGRVSVLKGAIASFVNLKPIVSLDSTGRGTAFGASFSSKSSLAKILSHAKKDISRIQKWAVVHASCPEKAAAFALEVSRVLGSEPEYIMEISPLVGIHAGIGAVALAWI
ncbi:MAG TPA: DegV family protein [Treponemataceae bacterium]|nr:DegV family protein [Treponemataceae bacterium]